MRETEIIELIKFHETYLEILEQYENSLQKKIDDFIYETKIEIHFKYSKMKEFFKNSFKKFLKFLFNHTIDKNKDEDPLEDIF